MVQKLPPATPTASDRICLHAISKRYGAINVLDNVSFSIKVGEVHGLLGANGAGKSTLCKILSGLTKPTAGQIFLDDRPVELADKRYAEALGIEIVQQELNLISTLSVAENLLLSKLPSRFGVLSKKRLHQQADELLAKVGLSQIPAATPINRLGIGQQQLIEIAKSLRSVPKLLILDEPTASLSNNEVENLFERIAELKSQGTSILYISHRLDEVKAICDRITILRDGQHVMTDRARDISTDEMVAWMSGEGVDRLKESARSLGKRQTPMCDPPTEPVSTPPIALRIDNLCSGAVRHVSLEVKKGEILGITGLVGAGRTELLRAIFGADLATSGVLYLNGVAVSKCFRSPAESVAAGFAMVTEDRKSTGLILSYSVFDNALLATWKTPFSRWGLLRRKTARAAVEKVCNDLFTKYESLDQSVSTLSGGNQQKVVLAKWLLRGANIFLMDEPTRGIDVASRNIIYDVIRDLTRRGATVLLVSSDMEELFSLCDRIAVMSNGRVTAEFERGNFDKNRIMSASFVGHTSLALNTLAKTPDTTT